MKRKSMIVLILLFAVAVFPLASAFAQEKEVETPTTSGQAQAPSLEPSAPALWEYLQQEKYRENWRMWPGKSAFYSGTEPHGSLLTTYVNQTAHAAIEAKAGSLPIGSIVVKENYSQQKALQGITVMHKVEGFNPEGGDWFWAKYGADGNAEASGKVDMCIQCHGTKKDNDYIMTAPLK
jgi:hypothetical protein